jgi:hypothetical protein
LKVFVHEKLDVSQAEKYAAKFRFIYKEKLLAGEF